MSQRQGRRKTDQVVRMAIVGAGIMGTNHARLLSTIPGYEVVAVVDPNAERAAALARTVDAEVLELDQLAGRVDAAVIAGPSDVHAELGCPLLEAGIDLLVEKPIASTVADGLRLVNAARDNDCLLMIGHIERFNAAVVGLQNHLNEPLHFEFTRVSPYPKRISADVVVDLMIHDLDLIRMFTGSEKFPSVSAVGRAVKSDGLDVASCLLTSDAGVTATLTASRIGQNKIRSIEVTQEHNFMSADLLRQDINIHRVEHSEFVSDHGTRYSQSGVVEIPFLERTGEPLRAELEAFLHAVVNRVAPPVTGEDGLAALEFAMQISSLASER
jgi:predicted dehydrogenase